jgi:hypothetical protein
MVKIAVDDAFSGGDPARNSPYPVLSLAPFVAVVRRIPLAVTTLAMLMSCFTVNTVLKKNI